MAQTSGEIINNSGHLEFQQATRCLSCNLENMQIKKIKRSKKNAESVTEEKFALLFKSKFQMADMQFNVSEFRFLYILFCISLIFLLQMFAIIGVGYICTGCCHRTRQSGAAIVGNHHMGQCVF